MEKSSSEMVSVIMPSYNAGKYLPRSIDSILNQSYSNLELLITDDNSDDPETLAVLKRYAEKDSRVRVYYKKENKGPGHARNNSIKNARGRYIAFCDSDDRWVPDKLERQVAFMQQKKCALSYSSYILCDANNNEEGIFIAPERITFSMLKRDNKIGFLTAMYDIEALGGKIYMPTFRKRQDWALFIIILRQCGEAYGITAPLAYYCQHKNSVSSGKLSLIKYNVRVYRDVLGYSYPASLLYFFTLFAPTYALKVAKKGFDSLRFKAMRRKKKEKGEKS